MADFLANFKEIGLTGRSADGQTIEMRRAFCSQSQLAQSEMGTFIHFSLVAL